MEAKTQECWVNIWRAFTQIPPKFLKRQKSHSSEVYLAFSFWIVIDPRGPQNEVESFPSLFALWLEVQHSLYFRHMSSTVHWKELLQQRNIQAVRPYSNSQNKIQFTLSNASSHTPVSVPVWTLHCVWQVIPTRDLLNIPTIQNSFAFRIYPRKEGCLAILSCVISHTIYCQVEWFRSWCDCLGRNKILN